MRPGGGGGNVAETDFGDAVFGIEGDGFMKLLIDDAGERGSGGGVFGAVTISG